MGLRLNRRRTDTAAYETELARHDLSARRCGAEALVLSRPCRWTGCPDSAAAKYPFRISARSGPRVSMAEAGQRVLDACAAPGEKTAHVLELADVALTALDVDAAVRRA